MLRSLARRLVAPLAALSLAPLAVAAGCTCGGGAHRDDQASSTSSTGATGATTSGVPLPLDGAASLEWDLQLHREALVGFGNATPLPVSSEFQEVVPALDPPLERAAGVRKQLPIRVRADRDVPFGQLTRMMQAAIAYRVADWELVMVGVNGELQSIGVKAPGGLPRGNCWARAWVGPDQRVLVGLDAKTGSVAPSDGGAPQVDAGDGLAGVLAWQQDGRLAWERVAAIVARLDRACPEGVLRVYAQPTGQLGPVFDLLRGFADVRPAPHVHTLQLAVPSLGPLDSTTEVIK